MLRIEKYTIQQKNVISWYTTTFSYLTKILKVIEMRGKYYEELVFKSQDQPSRLLLISLWGKSKILFNLGDTQINTKSLFWTLFNTYRNLFSATWMVSDLSKWHLYPKHRPKRSYNFKTSSLKAFPSKSKQWMNEIVFPELTHGSML